jgi:hypothetical protein
MVLIPLRGRAARAADDVQVRSVCAGRDAFVALRCDRRTRSGLTARQKADIRREIAHQRQTARDSIRPRGRVNRWASYPPISVRYPQGLHRGNIPGDAASAEIVVVSTCYRVNGLFSVIPQRLSSGHGLPPLWITAVRRAKIRAPLRIALPGSAKTSGSLGPDAAQRVGSAGLPPIKHNKRLLQRQRPGIGGSLPGANEAKKEVDGRNLARLLAPARA